MASCMDCVDFGRHLAGGPAVASGADGRRRAVLPLVLENELAIVDADSGESAGPREDGRRGAVRRGHQPRCGHVAYVSNWGGRWPKAGDPTRPRARSQSRSGRRRRAWHRRQRDRRAASTSPPARYPHHRRRSASDRARLGRAAPAALRRQRQQRFRLRDRHPQPASSGRSRFKPFGRRCGVAPTALALSPTARRSSSPAAASTPWRVVGTADGAAARARSRPAGIPTSSRSRRTDALAVGTLLGVGSGAERTDPRGASSTPIAARSTSCRARRRATRQLHDGGGGKQPHGRGAAPSSRRPGRRAPTAFRSAPASRRSSSTSSTSSRKTAPTTRCSATSAGQRRSLARDVRRGRHAEPPRSPTSSSCSTTSTPPAATAPTATSGSRRPTKPPTPVARLRRPQLSVRRHRPARLRRRRLSLGLALRAKKTVRVFGEYAAALPETDRGQRDELLARWRNGEDFTARAGRSRRRSPPLNRILARNYPRLHARTSRTWCAPRSSSKELERVGDGRHDAQSRHGAAAERSHPRHDARSPRRQGDGRRQRSRARPDRRGAVARRRSGRRWPSSSSRTTRRTASITWTATAPSRWRSRPTSGAATSTPPSTPPEHGQDDRADSRPADACRCSI